MKYTYPGMESVIDTDCDKVNTLIIENQKMFTELLMDLSEQVSGVDGKSVLSDNDKILNFGSSSELLTQFIPFQLNTKTLQMKVNAALEKLAVNEEYYSLTNRLLGDIETYFYKISHSLNCDLSFTKINVASLVKSVGIEFNETYDSLGEKIIDYFELVYEFDKRKLFFTVNLRSYIDDYETELFFDTVLNHGYDLIMIEAYEHELLKNENRVIIDSSLCEIK